MDLVSSTDARLLFLRYLISKWGPLRIGLYQHPHTPDPADDVGTYQAIEADFPVYVRLPITSWPAVVPDSDGNGVALGTFATWTVSHVGTPNEIYGYFVVDLSNNLLWAQADPFGPVPMVSVGQTYQVRPQLALGQLAP